MRMLHCQHRITTHGARRELDKRSERNSNAQPQTHGIKELDRVRKKKIPTPRGPRQAVNNRPTVLQ
jgi:hypothetical protein